MSAPGDVAAAKAADNNKAKVVTMANASSTVLMVSNFWRDFDLEGLRGKLDEEGMQIAENQEKSLSKRKELADATKDFKKKKDFTQKDVSGLLKSYQEEIDRLTKRAKMGEGAFLALYQKLYEAPDPANSLAAAMECMSRVAELEAQTRKMAQELAEYQAESKGIVNQEVTIKKLQDEARAMQAALDEKDRQIAQAKEAAAAEADSLALTQVQEREEALTSALAEAQDNLRELKSAHAATQNQLFQVTSQSEEDTAGMSSQLDLATQEMERAEERYLGLQREKAGMLAKMEQMREPGASDELQQHKQREESLQAELSTQRERVSYLQSALSDAQRELADEHAGRDVRVAMLREALEAQEARSTALEQELANRPAAGELESLRQQVRALQAVGFSQLDSGEDDQAEDDPARKLGPPGSLEAMLLEKNRHLEHQLTRSKLELADLRGEVEAEKGRVTQLEAEAEDKDALIEKLEESVASLDAGDLHRAQSGGAWGEDYSRAGRSGGIGLLGDEDGGNGGGDGGEQTMISVVCQQRDRFRKRCLELEEAVQQGVGEVLGVRNQLKAAQADNVALVERIRYLQGYGGGGGGKAGGGGAADVENRYTAQYEDQINPFSQFQARQKDSQRRKMGVPERAVYIVGSMVFGNKYARLFVFFYAVVMHLVVFATIFQMSHHHHRHVTTESLCSREMFMQSTVAQPQSNQLQPNSSQSLL